MTTQFIVGQEYKVKGSSITITRRTEKSVWFLGWDGKEVRRKPETVSMLGERFEVIRYYDLSIARACDVVAETIEVNETIQTEVNEPNTTKASATETSAKFSDTHTIIVESIEPIKDVEYSEICHAFDLNDGESFLSFGEVYVYSKPFSFTNDGIYYVPYETLKGRSGGSYKVKVIAKAETINPSDNKRYS